MENSEPAREVSYHLKVGVWNIAVAAGCMVCILFLGWEGGACLFGMLMILALAVGWLCVLCGLFLRANRRGRRLWKHVGVLLLIPPLFFLGNHLRLLDLRTRLAVMLTGGQGELQAWAVTVLDEPRDLSHSDAVRVPGERWSKQVRRLKPKSVYVRRVFENGQEGVLLGYGGGFFHWWIVIGRPGSRPDPRLAAPNSGNSWLRWADGIYDWQQ